MSWKDFFYYQKRDKNAILALLILIVVTGTGYIITKPKLDNSKVISNDLKIDKIDTSGKTSDSEQDTNEKSYHYNPSKKLKQGETIELNNADTAELKMIPGIGTSYANRIVKYRNLLGGYSHLNQLREVYGMDNDLYNKIKPHLTIKQSIRRLKINSASFRELIKHPYINYKQAKIIADIRERKGKIESLNRLSLLDEFSDEDIIQLSPYLSFD